MPGLVAGRTDGDNLDLRIEVLILWIEGAFPGNWTRRSEILSPSRQMWLGFSLRSRMTPWLSSESSLEGAESRGLSEGEEDLDAIGDYLPIV